MPKVTEAHLESRRQQILDAAFVCFGRQGFHQTTMQDIFREAGLSPGAVYRYFDSKEAIIEAICEGCEQPDLPPFEALQNAPTLTIMEQLSEKGFADLAAPEAAFKLPVIVSWWSEAMRSPEIKSALRDNMIEQWKALLTQIVARAQASGEIDAALEPEAVARVLLSTWQGLVLQKALDPNVDVATYLDVVRAMYSGSFWVGDHGDGAANSSTATERDLD